MISFGKSRIGPKAGDFFVYQIEAGRYGWGRVLRLDARVCQIPKLVLAYFYDTFTETQAPVPLLSKERLLIPPVLTNKLGWRDGYYRTVANAPVRLGEVYDRHCFRNASLRQYFDENGIEILNPFGPLGTCGVHSYASIQRDLCRKLGIAEPALAFEGMQKPVTAPSRDFDPPWENRRE
jgi:hypothetical protein